MFEVDMLTPFVITALSLILTPGPAKLLLLSTSASRGFRAGFQLALGIFMSDVIHVTLVAVGLGALIVANEKLRISIAVVGAAFLLYFALIFLGKVLQGPPASLPSDKPEKHGDLISVGLLLNLFNPLAIAFYVGLLPQFAVSTSTVPTSLQLGVYGGALVLIFLAVHTAIAFAATLFKSPKVSKTWFRTSYGIAALVLMWLCYRMLAGVLAAP